ncbi:MAG: competence/damage-inducible protein A [Chromatiales bacterium]|jgi:molybdopterin-biosynthesis enzyme MoeA-like protein|nr:competence/damage-inducible protein A [Chromatiales bacterium]
MQKWQCERGGELNIGLVIIGTELLTGKRSDGHMAKAIELLRARGLEMSWTTYLGDSETRLTNTLRQAMTAGDLVFSFGGIGATPDDLTRACAAAAAGCPLERHVEAAQVIEERFGVDAYPQRIHMAHLPKGACLIPNPVNRIAGFSVGHVHFVPGFPAMAWPMMEWVLDTHYAYLRPEQAPVETLICLPGVSEGQIMDVMQRFVVAFPDLGLSCLPSMKGDYRETELGVRGQPDAVRLGVDWLTSALANDGFEFQLRDTV